MAAFWGVLCKLHHHSSDKLGVADIYLSKIVSYGLQSVTQTRITQTCITQNNAGRPRYIHITTDTIAIHLSHQGYAIARGKISYQSIRQSIQQCLFIYPKNLNY